MGGGLLFEEAIWLHQIMEKLEVWKLPQLYRSNRDGDVASLEWEYGKHRTEGSESSPGLTEVMTEGSCMKNQYTFPAWEDTCTYLISPVAMSVGEQLENF